MDKNPTPGGRLCPLSAGLTLFGAAASIVIRLVPHPANMTPVGRWGSTAAPGSRWRRR
jgi:hypothetical protein